MRLAPALVLLAAFAPAAPLLAAAPLNVHVWNPAARPVTLLERWKTRAGDDPAWALPDWDDGGWEAFRTPRTEWFRAGQTGRGMRWYRASVRLVGPVDSLDPLFIRVLSRPGDQEFYWDGKLLGSNGQVSKEDAGGGAAAGDGVVAGAAGGTGRFLLSLSVPSALSAPGVHTLAVRLSVRHIYTGGMPQMWIGALRPLQDETHRGGVILMFLAGIFTITGVFHLVNFLSRVQRTHVLLSIFCFATALQTLPWMAAIYGNLGVEGFRWAIFVSIFSWAAMMTSLPLFFLSEFSDIPRRWYPIVGLAVAALAAPLGLAVWDGLPPGLSRIFSAANHHLGFVSILICLAVTGWAAWRRLQGAVAACLGLLAMLAGVALTEIAGIYYAWSLGLTVLILFLNGSLSRQWSRRNLVHQETQLRAVRLDIELLKKNIQPHFLLHSLRSITDWLDREPKTAVRLVNALAEELRMMLKMSSERVVSMAEEVKLCRSHLEVMGLRKRRGLSLDTEGVEGSEAIPPMVLHTLLEQGLDEAEDGDVPIRFRLQGRTGKGMRLRFWHDAPLKPRFARASDDTGMKYVRARLEEAFPGRWSLKLGQFQSGVSWLVEVEIRGSISFCPMSAALAAATSAVHRP